MGLSTMGYANFRTQKQVRRISPAGPTWQLRPEHHVGFRIGADPVGIIHFVNMDSDDIAGHRERFRQKEAQGVYVRPIKHGQNFRVSKPKGKRWYRRRIPWRRKSARSNVIQTWPLQPVTSLGHAVLIWDLAAVNGELFDDILADVDAKPGTVHGMGPTIAMPHWFGNQVLLYHHLKRLKFEQVSVLRSQRQVQRSSCGNGRAPR